MSELDAWLEIVRREAGVVGGQRDKKITLVATGYNPQTHAIKGMLVPHGVETGWIPIATLSTGNGFGVLVGPNVGDPQKLDGDQFDIEFENGDPNTPIARNRLFSDSQKPPTVQSGEILLMHPTGHHFFFDAKGNMTWFHNAGDKPRGGEPPNEKKGGHIKWDDKGNATVFSNKQKLTLDDGAGATHVHDGKGNITRTANTINDSATQGNHSRSASGNIADAAKTITHNGLTNLLGDTSLKGNFGVSGLMSFLGGSMGGSNGQLNMSGLSNLLV